MTSFRSIKTPTGACAALALMLLGTQGASAAEVCLTNASGGHQVVGTANNFRYELWNMEEDTSRTGDCMSYNAGATFSGRWTNAMDYLARRGHYFANPGGQRWDQRGGYKFRYSADWQPQWMDDANSSIGLYGWVHRVNNTGTTAEFYVIENWLQWNHSRAEDAEVMGRIGVNGQTYEVVRTMRRNAPTPWGNMDFPQYVSVRLERGSDDPAVSVSGVSGGNINVGQHFAAWQKLGLDMTGELVEVTFLAEGWKSSGTVNVSTLDITTLTPPTSIAFSSNTYNLTVDQTTVLSWTYNPSTYGSTDVSIVPTGSAGTFGSCNNIGLVVLRGQWFMTGLNPGSCTLTIYSQDGTKSGTATVNVTAGSAPSRLVEYRAVGAKGGEQMFVLRDGQRIGAARKLTTAFQTFSQTVYGEGEISLEFANDDAKSNGRAARVDYLAVDGVKREAEAQATNTGYFANGKCGGGGYSEWLHCSGQVKFGPLKQDHTIRIRARGNAGGEHIHLLINGQSVNTGWWLTTAFQEFTHTVIGDGDINIKYDNDGGNKDVRIDWVKVDSQNPRQAENMQYNTGAFANGRCGGGSYSEWMHCNGVIGFGKVSDNFD